VTELKEKMSEVFEYSVQNIQLLFPRAQGVGKNARPVMESERRYNAR